MANEEEKQEAPAEPVQAKPKAAAKPPVDCFTKEKITLQARPKRNLPLYHKGKIVHVTPKEPVSFVVKDLHYESKIHITTALQAGHVFEP